MKILFICQANICRSYMAEEMVKQLWPSVEVFSRGLRADSSYQVPAKVYAFLASRGITPTEHTSLQVSTDDLAQADFVFCMEQHQLDELLDRYAQFTDKIYLLCDFAFEEEKDLEDPVVLTGRAFEKAAMRLEKAVSACVNKLKQLR